ncbi:BQ2448_4964 [Microbotryum intermedium]|uniref:BQ2448_4964 protein n=1 Tax=Microbotryum intermedium TaxID=269621 RepID=A0A238FEL1_9BASI|nr:BQ2448_4964 [Microbotryum intermedium]
MMAAPDKCTPTTWKTLSSKTGYFKKNWGLFNDPRERLRTNPLGAFRAMQPGVPDQPHPIHLLMAEARQKWDQKVAAQSRTLRDAVDEYKRRYRMNPPLGFDKWFEWARQHDCQLLDEYDTIYRRILPFHSLSGESIRSRAKEMQANGTSLGMQWMAVDIENDGKLFNISGPRPRWNLDVLRDVKSLIPFNVTLTFNTLDEPRVVVTGEAFERHVEYALAHKFITAEEEDALLFKEQVYDYTESCSPDSEIRRVGYWDQIEFVPDLTRPKGFIDDHQATMSFCDWPKNQALHGSAFRVYPSPRVLLPLFSCSVMATHHDLMVPTTDQFHDEVGEDTIWSNKTYNQVLWRGSSTGTWGDSHTIKYSHRFRLTHRNVSLHLALNDTPAGPGPTTPHSESISLYGAKYFNFSFSGNPVQCVEECIQVLLENRFLRIMPRAEQNQFKYVIDVDGNGWSGRFHRLMRSNTMVLKSTIFNECYVPVSIDYTDLIPTMAFFIGDLEGRGSHDDLAERIATRGRLWTEMYWRYEDMQALRKEAQPADFLRLVLEYGRVSHKEYPTDTRFDYLGP